MNLPTTITRLIWLFALTGFVIAVQSSGFLRFAGFNINLILVWLFAAACFSAENPAARPSLLALGGFLLALGFAFLPFWIRELVMLIASSALVFVLRVKLKGQRTADFLISFTLGLAVFYCLLFLSSPTAFNIASAGREIGGTALFAAALWFSIRFKMRTDEKNYLQN